MKKIYFLIIVTLSFISIQAQNVATSIDKTNISTEERKANKNFRNIQDSNLLSNVIKTKQVKDKTNTKNGRKDLPLKSGKTIDNITNQFKSTTAVLWTDDFSNAANWVIGNLAGNTQNWVIGTTAPAGTYSSQIGPITSTTASNGFAMYDSDGIGVSTNLLGDQDAFVRTANTIDLTGHPYVKLRFEQSYRKYNSQTFVGIKVGTASWVEIEVNSNLATNDFGNSIVEVDISSIAGNQSNVKIYFRYYGEWDYVWMVDDVSIEDAFINDASTQFVFALGEQPVGVSDNIKAMIQNQGAGDITNLDVTLSITGANTFTNIQTVPLLQVGELLEVTFATYTPANIGLNNITVSVESDNFNANNSYSYYHYTGNNFAYADTSALAQGLGYDTSDGLILCKYSAEGSMAVTSVDIFISSDAGNPGNTVSAVVLDSLGNIVGTSTGLLIAATDLETWKSFAIPSQPIFANTDFYVGIAQTANTTLGYFPLGTQSEPYIRDDAYFVANTNGTGIVEANTYGRFMIKAIMGSGINYDASVISLISPNNLTGCALTNSESVTVRIENLGIMDISNFPVSYSLNGGTVVTETVNTTILSGSFYDYTFTNTIDLSAFQVYNFEAYTSLSTDEYLGNDTLVTSVTSGDAVITVDILTDEWGEETFWGLFNSAGDLIFSDGNYPDTALTSVDVCVLSSECYSLLVIDDYGDGIVAPGYYQVSYNNVVVEINTNFTGDQEWVYNIGGGCPANEIGINMVYTLGKLPKNQGSPHIITALIYNYGTDAQYNVPVTLTISGANSFTDIQTIPAILSGEEIYVEFSAFIPGTLGVNDISVSLPIDEDITNNSFSQYQEVTNITFSYSDTSAVLGGIGYNTSNGLLFNKHFMNSGGQVAQVGINLSDDLNSIGNTIYAVVLDADTNIIAQSADYIIQSTDINNILYLDIVNPPSFTNGIFFVGMAQTLNASTGYFPLGTQDEPYTRAGTYFGANLNGSDPVEYIDLGRFCFEAVLIYGPNWEYVNTGSNHTILVPDNIDVSIDGTQIEVGDYIGVFYDQNGVLTCGGYSAYTGTIDAISAWGAQVGVDDGFESGEYFTWKLWDATDETVYSATAVYNTLDFPNEGFYLTNGMSGLASLIATTVETQSINIVEGWSIVSTYLNVFQPNLDSIFSSIVNDIEIVKDGNGFVYWPQWGVNGIGNLTIGEGYQVNSIINQTLVLTGATVVPENTPLSIPSGWSILGYLRNSPMDIATALTSIVSDIIIVKNGDGLVYWPVWGVNGIGNMNPGEGYQINTSASLSYTYPANTTMSAKLSSPDNTSFELNTGSNMTVGFPKSCFPENIQEGDIISAFNSLGLKVGEAIIKNTNLVLTIWGDDFLTNNIDGLIENEDIQFSIQSESGNINFNVLDWESGSGKYKENGISIVKSISIEEPIQLFQNFPNPANTSTEITFRVNQDENVKIEILNLLGDIILIVTNEEYTKGDHKCTVITSQIPQGTYLYRLTANGFTCTKSMTINH